MLASRRDDIALPARAKREDVQTDATLGEERPQVVEPQPDAAGRVAVAAERPAVSPSIRSAALRPEPDNPGSEPTALGSNTRGEAIREGELLLRSVDSGSASS